MEDIIPLDQIPDKWLEKSRCPVCSTAPLKISHYDWEPDQFVCPNCGIHFQVAKNQPAIYVFQDPIDDATGYLGQWVEMKTLIQESRTKQEMKKISPPSQPLGKRYTLPEEPEEEILDPIYDKYSAGIIDSAASLYEMGNSRKSIKSTLMKGSELSEADIDEILDYVARQQRKKDAGSFKLPRWAIGCITIPVLMLISYLITIVFANYYIPRQLNAATTSIEYTVVDFEKLPGFIKDAIPEDVRNSQTPVATVTKFPTTTLPQAVCPTTSQAAVNLFGGQVADWQFREDQDLWILQANYLRTLNLPQDFIAIMPSLNGGLVIQMASGPAKIQNAFLVMIRCP